MWSVWSENVYVYLGTGLALLRLPGQPVMQFEHPATLPLSHVLRELEAMAVVRKGSAVSGHKPWRIHVSLSATMCPPVVFKVPSGVRRWSECLAIANSYAVKAWGLQPSETDEVVCRMDRGQPGVAASLLKGTEQQLIDWVGALEGRAILRTVAPLWAMATHTRSCQAKWVRALSILEPDGLTCLDLQNKDSPRAMVLPRPPFETDLEDLWRQEAAWWTPLDSDAKQAASGRHGGTVVQSEGVMRMAFASSLGSKPEVPTNQSGRFRSSGSEAWSDMWKFLQ